MRRTMYYGPNTKLSAPRTHFRPMRFRYPASAVADAAGEARVSLGRPPMGYYWDIERIGIIGAGSAVLYVGTVQDAQVADVSRVATKDIADEESLVFVPPGEELIIVFTGAPVGTLCSVRTQGWAVPV